MTITLQSDRTFKVWEYQVSHGQLLIRSPKAPATGTVPEFVTNLDLICVGVEYMALPRIFRGLHVLSPSLEEHQQAEAILGTPLKQADVRVLVSNGKRFPIVAASFAISENDWDIFESPFEFRSQYRTK